MPDRCHVACMLPAMREKHLSSPAQGWCCGFAAPHLCQGGSLLLFPGQQLVDQVRQGGAVAVGGDGRVAAPHNLVHQGQEAVCLKGVPACTQAHHNTGRWCTALSSTSHHSP
jgi:hypothetical protein